MRPRRRSVAHTFTTPQGSIWAIPHFAPITIRHIVTAPSTREMFHQHMDALADEQPVMAHSLMKQAARFAERHTKKFRKLPRLRKKP